MALDQVKTQVLILHSEQNALDNISAVIDERYTVHCATSGSEALQTLGETPIHVIISAQHLPGMSGVEALREAKKRSPETIGILLAGSADDADAGALVGEQEVFQVVRGGFTESDLNKLITEATQQMRLLALAESANDVAANPDEPAAEHIVMETSENGSAMISDGTGTWSTLPLDGESADRAVAPSPVDVLVLSKDREFLTTVQESSHATHVVRAVNTLAQAEQALAQHAVGVAVVDAGMVGDKVETLTEHLQSKKQRLVCIVAGRRDDGEMLMDLINRGKVYRFLLKPVSPGRARLAVEASVKHHLEAPDSAFEPGHVAPTPIRGRKSSAKPAGSSPTLAAAPADVVSTVDPTPLRESNADPASSPDAVSKAAAGTAPAANAPSASTVDKRAGETNTFRRPVEKTGDARQADSATVADEIPEATIAEGSPAIESAAIKRRLWPAMGILMAIVTGIAVLLATGYLLPGSDDPPPPTVTVEESPSDDPVTTRAAPLPDPEIEAAELSAVAEAAMLEHRLGDAQAALTELRSLDPEHARLPFLTAQVVQAQLRDNIDDARGAIRESRFEDAAAALLAARALEIADTAELDALEVELSSAQSGQQTDDLIARAAASIDADRLISPPNDNARHYLELALENETDNAAATQGLKVIAGKLVLRAMNELDQYRFDEAEILLNEARSLDATSSDIATSAEALADARERFIEEQRRDENARREKTRAEAQRLVALQQEKAQPEPAVDAVDRDDDVTTAAASPTGSPATNDSAKTVAPADPPPSGGAGADVPPGTFVEAQPSPSPSAIMTPLKSPVAVSSLTRTRYVAPKYPRSAERRNQAGWVDVVFTVAADGSTKDIEIKDSQPGDVFVSSATRAVEKWEFEPVLENGKPVERRANIRMMFAIE